MTSALMLYQSSCPKDFDLMVMLSHSVINFSQTLLAYLDVIYLCAYRELAEFL